MNHPQPYSLLIALVLAGSHEAYSELYEATIPHPDVRMGFVLNFCPLL